MITQDVRVGVCQMDIIKIDLKIKCLMQSIVNTKISPDSLNSYNKEVQDKIVTFRTRVTELEHLANEQENDDEQQLILTHVRNHRRQLNTTLRDLRRANLKSRASIETSLRDDLLQYKDGLRNRNETKQSIPKTTSDVTERMLDITRLMAVQAKHGDETAEVLLHSSQQIEETKQEMKSMTGHLTNTRKLMSKYGRRETTDKMLIGAAFFFFACCALNIIKNRIFPNLF